MLHHMFIKPQPCLQNPITMVFDSQPPIHVTFEPLAVIHSFSKKTTC